jgi:ribosomal protein S27AE
MKIQGSDTKICEQCGAPAGPDDVVPTQSPSDPLVVSECPRCGSIVSIGGHQW